jgi:GNAT superfamily N-acetyltransferase
MKIDIRPAQEQDAQLILRFITELAIYEKAKAEVKASTEDIKRSLFGADATAHGLICSVDDEPAGYAVFFYNYSTWLGRNGLYLEDLYISPQHRGKGAGKALFRHLARMAVEKDCGRFEWSVLDWNEPAIRFYESCGAQAQNEWVGYRLAGEALRDFAAG